MVYIDGETAKMRASVAAFQNLRSTNHFYFLQDRINSAGLENFTECSSHREYKCPKFSGNYIIIVSSFSRRK